MRKIKFQSTENNLVSLGKVNFPSPRNININMMPFIIGDKKSIPFEYQHYYPLIEKCYKDADEIGEIGYLSITEGLIKKGETQRRPFIHTDKPSKHCKWGGPWGKGQIINNNIIGGIYMASNIDNSCRAWDMHIDNPGHLGDCEHLKHLLKNEYMFKKNELVWLTDSCPHESLPLNETAYRQWFRFVTSKVSVWYEKHSTANSLGVLPNCEIIRESKFSAKEQEIK